MKRNMSPGHVVYELVELIKLDVGKIDVSKIHLL